MKIITLLYLFLASIGAQSQADTLLHQGTYRTYILHLPSGYSETKDYPLVLNLHGLGSNASQQQLYSQFDAVADEEEFIVVYANAINNSWDIFGEGDVDFLAYLVDTLRQQYSINECLFSMGMSQGGFLSYKLACELPYPISGIAIVTGSMLETWQNTCTGVGNMPVMHFHGTADQIVNYEGSFGISPVEEAVQWWASENDCNAIPQIISISDINQSDGSTAEKHQYNDCENESETVLYKIINGGHTWPGAFPVPGLGNTNQDINASELIGDFFSAQCSSSTALNSPNDQNLMVVYPNPADQFITVSCREQLFDVAVYDLRGRKIDSVTNAFNSIQLDGGKYSAGVYLISLSVSGRETVSKFVIMGN